MQVASRSREPSCQINPKVLSSNVVQYDLKFSAWHPAQNSKRVNEGVPLSVLHHFLICINGLG